MTSRAAPHTTPVSTITGRNIVISNLHFFYINRKKYTFNFQWNNLWNLNLTKNLLEENVSSTSFLVFFSWLFVTLTKIIYKHLLAQTNNHKYNWYKESKLFHFTLISAISVTSFPWCTITMQVPLPVVWFAPNQSIVTFSSVPAMCRRGELWTSYHCHTKSG